MNAICGNMGRTRDYYTKWSGQTEKAKYDITICGIQKNDTNWLIYKKRSRLTDLKNKLMVTKGESRDRDKLGIN